MDLILASSSPYRQALLKRLRLPFATASPDVDETPLQGEPPRELAIRLSRLKAETVAARQPGAVVIGSDQVASLGGQVLAKPGTPDVALAQLLSCQGRTVRFDTGICLLSPSHPPAAACIETLVTFRQLSEQQLRRYIELDQPLDCAGSFKWESLGISLFERLEGDDPTALEGLPLIALTRLLNEVGLDPLTL